MKVVATAETLGFISIVLLKVIEFLIQTNSYILTIYILDVQDYFKYIQEKQYNSLITEE